MTYQLFHGDCLDLLPTLADKSIDAIITDLPYGTTSCSWDEIIPFAPMWEQVKRLCKGVFVTTASQPFTSKLIMSNTKDFKYEWIWRKNKKVGFLNANKMPLFEHENIVVFCDGSTIYNPQMSIGKKHTRGSNRHRGSDNYGNFNPKEYESSEWYPTSVIDVKSQSDSCVTFASKPNRLDTHPTQKPVALYEYLIRTYTNEGETVLDFTMGSGTTGVACMKSNRNFIGIEKELNYFEIAQKRIAEAAQQPPLL
jgi:site-specific DNA-methyltransferase (adenine-specific)